MLSAKEHQYLVESFLNETARDKTKADLISALYETAYYYCKNQYLNRICVVDRIEYFKKFIAFISRNFNISSYEITQMRHNSCKVVLDLCEKISNPVFKVRDGKGAEILIKHSIIRSCVYKKKYNEETKDIIDMLAGHVAITIYPDSNLRRNVTTKEMESLFFNIMCIAVIIDVAKEKDILFSLDK